MATPTPTPLLSWAEGRSRTQAGILDKCMVLWLDLKGFTVQLSYPKLPTGVPELGHRYSGLGESESS